MSIQKYIANDVHLQALLILSTGHVFFLNASAKHHSSLCYAMLKNYLHVSVGVCVPVCVRNSNIYF